MAKDKKIRLALISGGESSEREVSLKGGDQVEGALDRDKYDIIRYDPAYDPVSYTHLTLPTIYSV